MLIRLPFLRGGGGGGVSLNCSSFGIDLGACWLKDEREG